jgi:hypothetical protein
MHFDELYPSKFLRASDLGGVPLTVTIGGIARDNVGAEPKVIITFASGEKALIANKTNGNTLCKLFGKETANWIGKQIVLVPTEVDFRGDMVEAIRIRAPRVAAQPAVAAAEMNDEIPF